jgi:hypothetical protein
MSWGEFFIGGATVFLAMVTFALVLSGANESKKERKRKRLKEQLEGLYSPLMSYIYLFNVVDEHFSSNERRLRLISSHDPKTAIWLLIQEIRGKYNFLAEPELRKELNKYYLFRDDPPYDEHGNYINEKGEKFLDILNKVQKMIVEDFERLSREYNDLVTLK